MKVEEYSSRRQQVGRWKVHILSYKAGDQYFCTVDNNDPRFQDLRRMN